MTQKKSIDVIIIAKNEQERLADCIRAVSWSDHVIVIDNNSDDHTAEIAKSCGATVISTTTEDFSDLRNLGAQTSQATWLLFVDADELVTPELSGEIRAIVNGYQDYAGYVLPRKNYYLGHQWPFMDGMIRLIQKSALVSWKGKLHEHAEVNGKIGALRYFVIHATHRTLQEMTDKTNQWSAIEAKLRFKKHHPGVVWWRLLRVMITGFWGSFFLQGGWKAGTVGMIESIYQAFSMFITYSKLWELQENT
jgi:glycosyltransferase involved in cell wall biosynthesis